MLSCNFDFVNTKNQFLSCERKKYQHASWFDFMKKLFKKIMGVITATLLLLSMFVAMRPLFSVLPCSFYQEKSCEAPVTGEIAGVAVSDDTLCLVPQTYKTAFVLSLQRLLSSATLIAGRALLDDDRQTVAQNDDYLLHNELNFNIPSVISRQPENENSSESEA